MIKTVSFAPPRSAHSRSSAASSQAKSASTPVLALDAPRVSNDGAASGSSPAKPRIKKASAKPQSELSLDLFGAPDEPVVAPVAAALETEKPRAKANKAKSTTVQAEIEPAEIEVDSTKNEVKPEVEAKPAKSLAQVKTKKARVPKDLAAQYGEKAAIRPIAPLALEAESPKKRLNKAERQARRDLMKPSESLIERLARANQIPLRKAPSEPRGKGWKFTCGRCGAISYFQTPGGLCACGTIAVKE